MSLTKVTNSMLNSALASVLDYGAVGDGVTDDTTAIQAAIDGSGGNVVFPDGTYRITSTINSPTGQNQGFKMVFEDAILLLDADNTVALRFGTQSNPPLFTGYFEVYGINVRQESGRTGNTGVAIDNVLSSFFQINEVVGTQYGVVLTGANNRGCAYNKIFLGNLFGNEYALQLINLSGGFSNQNTLIGGKINSTVGDTAITNNGNENTFIGAAIEGTWDTGVDINNRGGVYINIRTEGTFSTGRWDLSGTPSGLYGNTFIGCYTSPFDASVSTGQAQFGSNGLLQAQVDQPDFGHYLSRSASNSGNHVLTIEDKYSSSGASYTLKLKHSRSGGDYIKFTRGGGSRGAIIQGNDGGVAYTSDSSVYNEGFLKFGTYYIWVDTSGKLRIKNGAPTSATDGTIVGTQS